LRIQHHSSGGRSVAETAFGQNRRAAESMTWFYASVFQHQLRGLVACRAGRDHFPRRVDGWARFEIAAMPDANPRPCVAEICSRPARAERATVGRARRPRVHEGRTGSVALFQRQIARELRRTCHARQTSASRGPERPGDRKNAITRRDHCFSTRPNAWTTPPIHRKRWRRRSGASQG